MQKGCKETHWFLSDPNLGECRPGCKRCHGPSGSQDHIWGGQEEGKDSSKTNHLRFFSTNLEKPNVNHVMNQKSSEELEDFNNIKASLDELKVTVNENIYHARQAPPIDPEMITKKLSLCSESIIKSAMPL